MIKALKVVMIVWGALVVLSGLALIVIPDQMREYAILGEHAGHVKWIMGLLGAVWIAAGVWVIAASRDPIRHIYWVKFVITMSVIAVVAGVYSIIQGYVEFSQVMVSTLFDAVFAVAFLVFYPWRAIRGEE